MTVVIALAFWFILLCACLTAYAVGGRIERLFANGLIIATLTTWICQTTMSEYWAPFGYLLIDGALLAIAMAATLFHNRFWPIWFAGFQLVTVTVHVARLLAPAKANFIYGSAAEFWALPALLSFSLGLILDRRIETRSNTTTVLRAD